MPRFFAWRDSAGTARPLAWYEERAREADGKPTRSLIQTDHGSMEVLLYSCAAPLTTYNIASLAQRKYFDGQRCHRVVPNQFFNTPSPQRMSTVTTPCSGNCSGAGRRSIASFREIALSVSRFSSLFALALVAAVGCRPPRVEPLSGAVAPVQMLPKGTLPEGRRKIVFTWELRDGDIQARGDGVARIASPDSVRLDFFLGGGMGGGAAVLIGDSLRVPGPDMVRKLVPPRALLWASLGKFDLPAEPDTVVRVDGAVLRADIGAPVHWRATFRGDTLSRLERVDGGRLQEWVERAADHKVQYRNEAARRSLSLVILQSDVVAPFDPSIWRL